jgi:cardiolipin synthase
MAKKYVYITTPYLIVDHNMLTSLKNAAYRGVDVRIVVPHIPDKKVIFEMTKSNYKPLLEAGVKIYEYTPGFMHSKQIIVDDIAGMVGTINLDFRSLVHHYECGVMLYKTNTLIDIKNDFIEAFRVSEEKTLKNFKRSKLSVAINAAFSLITSMM